MQMIFLKTFMIAICTAITSAVCTMGGMTVEDLRSHIHNCFNGIGSWFYQALAGINPDETQPGYKNIRHSEGTSIWKSYT